MPTPTPRVGGRPWRRLVAQVLIRDRGICQICGHPGADTGGHIVALEDGGPELDPLNVQAEHGRKRTPELDGYTCPGNYAHSTRTPRDTPDRWTRPSPSRPWGVADSPTWDGPPSRRDPSADPS